ncbi:hypothetical protein [Lentzea kentuckyensis]|uniref:pPIWI_RE_Z domain-containing protein n=1 Tax=Lentzea kentuckyensis TaxID=360086 RepID=UPI000A3B4130|nr:hypothetical protein [Lentzea kentuckyensis]
MRSRTSWRKDLLAELKSALGGGDDEKLAEAITEVELALTLLGRVAPSATADAGWSLLNGYPVAQACGTQPSAEDLRSIAIARFRLTGVKSPYDFARVLASYEKVPADLRGFAIAGDGSFRRRDVPKVTRRWIDYDSALATAPEHDRDKITPAQPGEYVLATERHRSSVRIPRWLPLPETAQGHDLSLRHDRENLVVTRDQLLAAAQQMDGAEADGAEVSPEDGWQARIGRIIFEVRQANDRFGERDTFTIDGLLHMAGMLSVGKTTLVAVLAWHLTVTENKRVTVVLGDVTAVLRMVDLFNRLTGTTHAAPVIGESNRRTHVERIHRLDSRTGTLPLYPKHSGYQWVSTACGLDGLRTDSATPWPVEQAPCRSLRRPVDEDDSTGRREGVRGCPLWSNCQRHEASRALVTTKLWVATTASLIQTRVPRELNPEGMRYLEAAWRTMDLLIVDEADQVQAQLDSIFSPSQTLIGATESWLMDLWGQVDRELGRSQLAQLQDSAVLAWVAHLNLVRIATALLYNLLTGRSGRYLREWMGEDYFTGWTLATKLAEEWAPLLLERDEDGETSLLGSADADALRAMFDRFLDDPLGKRTKTTELASSAALVELVKTLHLPDEPARQAEFRTLVRRVPMKAATEKDKPGTRKRDNGMPENIESRNALRLELLVVTTVLADQLDSVIERWRTVEGRLDLRGVSPLMFHRPPQDFTPVIPDSPMGNVLGFRYRIEDQPRPSADDDQPGGQLSFFRYAGVGRFALVGLHNLFCADGVRGPNVLLLSGTSWAKNSPRYHIDYPVDVVLRAPSKEVEAIKQSRFYTFPLYPPDKPDQPYVISGISDRQVRRRCLQGMARALVAPRLGASRLEAALERITDPNRRRALILVGNYEEAKLVADAIAHANETLKDQVRYLVPDDRDFGADWLAPSGATALPRGEVETLFATGAAVLVAPLLAMERGHNILTDDHRAAIGAAFFFVRPHPRPDDLDYVTQTLNAWAISEIRNNLSAVPTGQRVDLAECARTFRHKAQGLWRTWLRRPLAYSALTGDDKDGMTWSQLVGIWQVIGRLVRGGCPAEVYFCDAKFAPRLMGLRSDEDDTDISLIAGMRSVLAPYFDKPSTDPDTHLVELLYEPLHHALSTLEGAPL